MAKQKVKTQERSFKEDFKKEIIKQGFPVIAMFDHWDACATIYAKSEKQVVVDDYGSQFVEDERLSSDLTLDDLTEEGLYKLLRIGIRPGHSEWDYALKEAEELFGEG